jgi:hypothetical protein
MPAADSTVALASAVAVVVDSTAVAVVAADSTAAVAVATAVVDTGNYRL